MADVCAWWMEGVFLTTVGIFGIFGNILSIYVLSRPEMQNPFNQTLIALSTVDKVYLILAIVDYAMVRSFDLNNQLFVLLFPHFIYPLTNITFCASIFLTLSVAAERYFAVCRPHQYNAINRSVPQTGFWKFVHAVKYTLPVLIFSAILNIPRFFETNYKWVIDEETDNSTGTPIKYNITMAVVFITQFRKDPIYVRYYIHWIQLFFSCLIPMALLFFFNIKIFLGVRQTTMSTRRNNSSSQRSENNLATILITIVVVFLVCHTPRVLLNLYEFSVLEYSNMCKEYYRPSDWVICCSSFTHLLLMFNSSVNFIIYCSIGKKFKTVLMSKFGFIQVRLRNWTRNDKTCAEITMTTPEQAPTANKIPENKTAVILKNCEDNGQDNGRVVEIACSSNSKNPVKELTNNISGSFSPCTDFNAQLVPSKSKFKSNNF